MLCFVLINSVLLNLLCLWILFWNASSHSCSDFSQPGMQWGRKKINEKMERIFFFKCWGVGAGGIKIAGWWMYVCSSRVHHRHPELTVITAFSRCWPASSPPHELSEVWPTLAAQRALCVAVLLCLCLFLAAFIYWGNYKTTSVGGFLQRPFPNQNEPVSALPLS